MNKLILLLMVAAPLFARGQETALQGSTGDTYSVKKLAIEVRSEWSGTDILAITSLNPKPKRLVKGQNPTWSPDGNKLAYCVSKVSVFGQMQQIFGQIQLINADGSGHMQLTNLEGGACPTDWSHDGQKIAFIGYGAKGPSVFVMDKNGENVTPIAVGDGPARWSPDGKQLVFCRFGETRGASNSIWIANADGTGITKVIEDMSPILEPTWFPDGKSIIFCSEREHKRRSEIFRVNLDGTGLEAIAVDKRASLYFPVPSPDGREIVVDAIRSPEENVVLYDLASHHTSVLAHGLHPSVVWEKP